LDKATGMAKSSARGGFKLFIGVSISSVITALSLILVLRLLGNPDDYGIITTALIFPSMFALFKDWGINSAMIKYLAQYRSEKKTHNIKNVMVAGMLFELVTGVLLTLFCFFMADLLATNVFHLPETKALIEVAALTILADSFLKVSQSTFIGLEKLEFHSLTLILNAGIRCFLAPLLVFLGYGIMGAIQGLIVAQIIAGIIGIIIFYFRFFRDITKEAGSRLNLTRTLKTLLRYGLPLSVSFVVAGFLPQFFNTLLTQSVEFANGASYTTALGNFQAAVNFTVIITFFTVPIGTVLFPAFSKIKGKEENHILKVVFQSSVKYGALLTIPVTLMIMVLSEPIVFTIVGTEYTQAPFFLTLYSSIFLYALLGNLSLGNFLNGQGETKTTMKLAVINLGVGLLLGWMLIPQFEVVGLIVATSIAGLPSILLGLWWIRKHFGATIDWMSSTKIFLASCIAAGVTYLVLLQLNSIHWLELIVGGISFSLVYLVAAPLIRAVDKKDVHSLREMLSDLGPLSYVFNIPLSIIEKLSDIFKF
jgi:O-antigen/teichoic acid export membrane protein